MFLNMFCSKSLDWPFPLFFKWYSIQICCDLYYSLNMVQFVTNVRFPLGIHVLPNTDREVDGISKFNQASCHELIGFESCWSMLRSDGVLGEKTLKWNITLLYIVTNKNKYATRHRKLVLLKRIWYFIKMWYSFRQFTFSFQLQKMAPQRYGQLRWSSG